MYKYPGSDAVTLDNQDALFAALFGMLANAHNRLAQYEREEAQRQQDAGTVDFERAFGSRGSGGHYGDDD